jgi:hypothetical protein
LIDVEAAGGGALGELLLLNDLIDGDGQTHFGLFLIGVAEAEVAKDIAGALENA